MENANAFQDTPCIMVAAPLFVEMGSCLDLSNVTMEIMFQEMDVLSFAKFSNHTNA